MKNKSVTSINRDGNISLIGSFGFTGTLQELKELINGAIGQYDEKTKCSIVSFGSFPHRHTPHIILMCDKNGSEL